jgi:Transposase IS4
MESSSGDDGDDLDEDDSMYAQPVDVESVASSDEDDDEDNDSIEGDPLRDDIRGLLDCVQWNFSYEDALEDNDSLSPYNGPDGLKPGVAESFSNPFEALQVCGGLDYEFAARLAHNSNEYARKFLLPKDRNNRLHGKKFHNITTEEMFHFLGITLRISLSPVDWGGYEAYFSNTNKQVFGLEITGTLGFAQAFMMLWRYKQIRSAFHPEDRAARDDGGDKCFQLYGTRSIQ